MTTAPRPRDSAATRAALLDAARALFAERGYDGTTVRGVAERAGVNQALLFRYFGNKESLFAEAVSEQALAPLSEGPPETLLERLLLTMFGDAPGSAMFVSVLTSEGPASETVRTELGAAYRAAFAALAGTDDPVDADLRATLLLAWLLGIGQARAEIGVMDRAVVDHVLRTARTLLSG